MRSTKWAVLFMGLMSGTALAGADKPIMAPPPDWVKPVALPPKPEKAGEAPVHILLLDQQSKLEPGRVTAYVDLAMLIQSPEGLQAGNLSLPWNPETNEMTVHKLVIHRDGKLIDILAGGQNFTVVRREPNLENATLDGMLTANIQPEGLQVGDVLEYAVTLSSADPIFKDHAEELAGGWNGVPFSRTHMSVQWPSSMPVAVRQNGALPPLKPVKAGNVTKVELSLDNVQPTLPPRLAPARYGLGRLVEFSDFKSWADVGALMAPLYAKASVIPAEGPLRAEVEKIKAASAEPVKRADAALALVQDRVRYVALLMGTGGYVPASATETWGRRYGDCKAKSALLLALLKELGIEAEPVAANVISGDGIDQRLPMIGLFNHVLVRAHIGGADYWLDGTRQGDTSLARLRVPDFGWGLPLVAQGAALVRMQPKPLEQPDTDMEIAIDARQGVTLPAPIKVTNRLRGDAALSTRQALAGMTEAQRDQALRNYWKGQLKDIEVTSASARYDAATGEEILTMEGKATMDWSDGWYHADRVSLGYEADFVRPAGQDQNAPFANDYPDYWRTVETIQLPPGFPDDKEMAGIAVNQTVAGTAYFRKASMVGNMFRIEASARALTPEFAASEAPAAKKALKAMSDNIAAFAKPANLRMTNAEIDAELKTVLTTADGFLSRGARLAGMNRLDEAKAAYESALKIDPDHAGTRAAYALLLMSRGDLAGATKLVGTVDIASTSDLGLLEMRGRLALMQGDPKTAIAAFDREIARLPNAVSVLNMRAQAHGMLNDYQGLLADTAASLKVNRKQPDVYLARAQVFARQGQSANGIAEADTMLEVMPDDGYAHILASRILDRLGQHVRALKIIDRAIELRPSGMAYLNRADLRDRSDVAGRLADAEAALKVEPDMPDAMAMKARLLSDRGDFASAIKSYSTLVDRAPNNPTTRTERGILYARSGDKARADADFVQARKDARDSVSLNSICYQKATAGVGLERALEDCDAALVKEADSAAILDSKAFVLLRLGRLDDSIAYFDKALAKSSELAPSLYGRAIAWLRKGNKEKAQADKDAALKIDPNIVRQFEGYGVTMPVATP